MCLVFGLPGDNEELLGSIAACLGCFAVHCSAEELRGVLARPLAQQLGGTSARLGSALTVAAVVQNAPGRSGFESCFTLSFLTVGLLTALQCFALCLFIFAREISEKCMRDGLTVGPIDLCWAWGRIVVVPYPTSGHKRGILLSEEQ